MHPRLCATLGPISYGYLTLVIAPYDKLSPYQFIGFQLFAYPQIPFSKRILIFCFILSPMHDLPDLSLSSIHNRYWNSNGSLYR